MHVMNEQQNSPYAGVPTPEQQVARYLRLLRQGHGWSQQDVAEKMKPYGYQWSQATVTRLESASRPIRINELTALATLYSIPVTQLLEIQLTGSDFDDLDALEKEIASLTERRNALIENLEEARYKRMVAQEYEGALASSLARLTARLESLMRWHPQMAETRLEGLKEIVNIGPAQP
jgi:transcriptional regulator with XRE-family HTH domain